MKALNVNLLVGAAFLTGALGMHWIAERPVDAAETTVVKEYIDPVPSFAFTQVVTATANGVKTIHVSGQVAGGETHEEQTENACRRILERIAKAGASESDVVKLVVFIKSMDADAVAGVKAGKDKVFTADHQPAATWVGVTNLVSPRALVEIEAIAIVAE